MRMPMVPATLFTVSPSVDSSRASVVSVRNGKMGRNWSRLMSATILLAGTVGCAAKYFDPSRPFSSPVTTQNSSVRFMQALGHIDQRSHVSRVVKCAIVDLVVAPRLSNAVSIEVRRHHHVLLR